MSGNLAVFGIYSDRATVDNALIEFRAAGFRNTDVSVLLPKNLGSKDLATEKSTKAPEGVTAGVSSGAVLGGALGWLVGIGALAIPGLGPFIAAGPIMAALAGVGVGSAVGGFTGALIGFGIPEYEAKRYEGRVRKGGILVSIHCDDTKCATRPRSSLRARVQSTLPPHPNQQQTLRRPINRCPARRPAQSKSTGSRA